VKTGELKSEDLVIKEKLINTGKRGEHIIAYTMIVQKDRSILRRDNLMIDFNIAKHTDVIICTKKS